MTLPANETSSMYQLHPESAQNMKMSRHVEHSTTNTHSAHSTLIPPPNSYSGSPIFWVCVKLDQFGDSWRFISLEPLGYPGIQPLWTHWSHWTGLWRPWRPVRNTNAFLSVLSFLKPHRTVVEKQRREVHRIYLRCTSDGHARSADACGLYIYISQP